MKTATLLLIALLSLAAVKPVFAARDTLRCGSKIVRVGLTMEEVLKLCGEPQTREIETVPVRSGNRVTGTTESQVWIYQRSGGKPASLTFDQNKLVRIEYP